MKPRMVRLIPALFLNVKSPCISASHVQPKATRFHEAPANRPTLYSQRKVIECHLLSAFSRQRRCLLFKIGVG